MTKGFEIVWYCKVCNQKGKYWDHIDADLWRIINNVMDQHMDANWDCEPNIHNLQIISVKEFENNEGA